MKTITLHMDTSLFPSYSSPTKDEMQEMLQKLEKGIGINCYLIDADGKVLASGNQSHSLPFQCDFLQESSVCPGSLREKKSSEPSLAKKNLAYIHTTEDGFSIALISLHTLHPGCHLLAGPFWDQGEPGEMCPHQTKQAGLGKHIPLISPSELPVLMGNIVPVILSHLELFAELLTAKRKRTIPQGQFGDRYRELTDNLPQIVFEMDLDGRITFANQAVLTILGYQPEKVVEGLKVNHFFPPSEHAKLSNRITRFHKGEVLDPEEYLLLRKDGSLFPGIIFSRPIMEGSTVVGIRGLIFDITQRKHAEEQLRESELRYRALFEGANDAILIFDEDSIIDCNQKAEDLLKRTRQEILSSSLDELSLPNREKLVAIQQCEINLIGPRNTKPAYIDWTCHLIDGTQIETELSISQFEMSGNLLFHALIRDCTDRKIAEKELRESEFRFRLFFNTNPLGILLVDVDGQLLDANKAFLQDSGYTLPELCNRNCRDIMPQEHQTAVTQLITSLRCGIDQPNPLHVVYTTKQGDGIPISIHGWRVVDEASTPLYLGLFLRNLSDELLLAEEKTALEKQVMQAQKSEAIGTLAGGIAHDFNNILGGIIGYTELALHSDFSLTPHRMHEYLERVLESGNRARDLVQQILRFTRHGTVIMEPIRLAPIIKESIRLLRSTLPTTIEIHQELESINDQILGDPTQIHQIVMNLGINAYHAMREHGGTLKISLERIILNAPKEYMSLTIPPGPYLLLQVTDTGTGIPPAIIERIFEPYFTTKKINEGSGLGLAVTRGIVKNHNGLIEMVSDPGRGTNARVYLPCSQIHEGSRPQEEEMPSVGQGENILIVDDEAFFLEVIEESLKLLNYTVTATRSSLKTLQLFRENPSKYDLIITDQTMPEMTGAQLAQEIRKIDANIPIILCTGYSETVTEQSAKYYGITNFLMKPINIGDLGNAVAQALSTAKEH